MTHPNAHGESFAAGDAVKLRPDNPYHVDDTGEVVALGEYGPYHVTVAWQGPTSDTVHIDRIAHEEPMT